MIKTKLYVFKYATFEGKIKIQANFASPKFIFKTDFYKNYVHLKIEEI